MFKLLVNCVVLPGQDVGRNYCVRLAWQRPALPEYSAPGRRMKPQTNSEHFPAKKMGSGFGCLAIVFATISVCVCLLCFSQRLFFPGLMFLKYNLHFTYFKCMTLYRITSIAEFIIQCKLQALLSVVFFMHVYFSQQLRKVRTRVPFIRLPGLSCPKNGISEVLYESSSLSTESALVQVPNF